MYYCCGITDIGNTRRNNEDAFLIQNMVLSESQLECNLENPFIIAVADGVAGENSGEVASRLCLKFLDCNDYSNIMDLKKRVMYIHENLRYYGSIHNNSLNMQTTLCALAVDQFRNMKAINVGDSRMYQFSHGELRQITKDQSLIQFLLDSGGISDSEKDSCTYKNVIFPIIGNLNFNPIIDIYEIGQLKDNDIILICSDGLSDFVPKEIIQNILIDNIPLQKRLNNLVCEAINYGSKDNITAVALIKINV